MDPNIKESSKILPGTNVNAADLVNNADNSAQEDARETTLKTELESYDDTPLTRGSYTNPARRGKIESKKETDFFTARCVCCVTCCLLIVITIPIGVIMAVFRRDKHY